MVEKLAYGILGIAAIGWLIVVIAGLVAAWPEGIVGLLVIFALGLLLIKAVVERLNNAEDKHYSDNVHQ